MSILVTRPLPQGEALVSRLRAMGRVAWSFPLIEFTPGRELPALGDALARLGPDDLLFALSQHAVEFAHARLQQQGLPWPTSPRYFAIGRTTALALHTVSGQHIHYPLDREISEVLLQLPELQNIAGKNALILRGNGGRELLGATLTERGARVTFCECYQRSAKHYDGAEEAMRWQSRHAGGHQRRDAAAAMVVNTAMVSRTVAPALPRCRCQRTSGPSGPGTGLAGDSGCR